MSFTIASHPLSNCKKWIKRKYRHCKSCDQSVPQASTLYLLANKLFSQNLVGLHSCPLANPRLGSSGSSSQAQHYWIPPVSPWSSEATTTVSKSYGLCPLQFPWKFTQRETPQDSVRGNYSQCLLTPKFTPFLQGRWPPCKWCKR
jgi:hypothetical protein